jgi:hypothetical protein
MDFLFRNGLKSQAKGVPADYADNYLPVIVVCFLVRLSGGRLGPVNKLDEVVYEGRLYLVLLARLRILTGHCRINRQDSHDYYNHQYVNFVSHASAIVKKHLDILHIPIDSGFLGEYLLVKAKQNEQNHNKK